MFFFLQVGSYVIDVTVSSLSVPRSSRHAHFILKHCCDGDLCVIIFLQLPPNRKGLRCHPDQSKTIQAHLF